MNETTTLRDTRDVDVDVAIIGAGTAGMAAYRAATKHGKSALLIEAGKYGTTCARVGCMPSKLLIAAADAAHKAANAGPFGVLATVAVDRAAVMERVRRERDRFVGFVLESVEGFPEAHRLVGRARFVGPTALDVDGTRVTARSFVVATGSSPVIPSLFDRVRDRLVVNDDVFAWNDLPDSVAVFGAGVIGLELGQALHRLGVRVRIFGRSGSLGPLRDPVVKAAAAEAFAAELAVDFDAKVSSIEAEGAGVAVTFTDKDGNPRIERFDHALVAAGRKPNVGSLGLEAAGIDAGTKVDRTTLQWGATNVFLAGDVNGDIQLLHEAADEGAIAGVNAAAYPDVLPGHRRTMLGIAFTEPNLAVVGGGYDAARAQGPFVAGAIDFRNQGRSRVMLENRGAARLYANPVTRRFLGAELAGPRGEHLAHLLAWAHQAEMTIDRMLSMPFYHPVVEEGLRTALREVCVKLNEGTVEPTTEGSNKEEKKS